MRTVVYIFLPLLYFFQLNANSIKAHNEQGNYGSDTTVYNVYIGIETYIRKEKIKTYNVKDTIYADALVETFQENIYTLEEIPTKTIFSNRHIRLTPSQLDTLKSFKTMLASNKIRHNQGLKNRGKNWDLSNNSKQRYNKSKRQEFVRISVCIEPDKR